MWNLYQIIRDAIPGKYYSAPESKKKLRRKWGVGFIIIIILIKAGFYFLEPGVNGITLWSAVEIVFIQTVFILGAGFLPGIFVGGILILLRIGEESVHKAFVFLGVLGVFIILYLHLKKNYPELMF